MFPRLGFGLGLRPTHYPDVLAGDPRVDWWEVISENFMVAGGNPRRVLRQVRERWPVVLHGVSLSIGSVDPLDEDYLTRLATLVAEVEPAIVSDHLCWTRFGGHSAHDLWPVPYTDEALATIVDRVGRVQDRLRRRILLENPSSYVTFEASHIAEPEFLAEVARRADCGILLDVNNVYVSAKNHGWDPYAYLGAIPIERVGQIHLAGHTDHGSHLLDTHDQPVCDAVWELYAAAIARFGAVSSMIERDDDIPPLPELVAELDRARIVAGDAHLVARSRWRRRSPCMGELAALQRTFYDRVTTGREADASVASGDLGIYARMYASRLHDTLADDYPKVRTALGDDSFAAMVARYLQLHPPRSYTLRDAGLELPSFLRHSGAPWIAELAELERARVEVFDGPDAAPLAAGEVAAIGVELPELVLRLVTSSVVVPLAWAADELWSAIEDGAPAITPERSARTVLVWRRDVSVLHRTLDVDEAELAPRLAAGVRFSDVCEVLATTCGDDAPARATELLLRWLQAEVLVTTIGL